MAVRPQVPEHDRLLALTQPMLESVPAHACIPEPIGRVTAIAPLGAEEGWVPARDTDPSGHDTDPSGHDAADVAARRASALVAASEAYAAAHGHPLTHPRAGEGRSRGAPRRWAVPVRLALTAALALGLVGGAVALRAASVAHAGLVPIELPPVGVALSAATAGTDEAVGAAPTAGTVTAGASADDFGSAGTSLVGSGTVVVHVVGQVTSPGVVELPTGSRVDDAIRAAGGATPGADFAALNLARIVIDGEQVVVPAPGGAPGAQTGAQPAGQVAGAGTGGSVPAAVDLNVADAAALDVLPGIGPVLAARIVDWREAHRRFTDIDQLGEIDGIGPTLLVKLRPLVRV
jgi:competence protein ComEA